MVAFDNKRVENQRVVSGMRPTGRLHLGNYYGALKNWLKLQNEYECLFFAADWHALTTDYAERHHTESTEKKTWEMIEDWLAAGLDPKKCTIFIQSQVPEHAELHVLLSMITPLGWLERVPTYKDQQEKLKNKDLSTYGFLGYPTLQSADILIYKANLVPVGEDQVSHVEFTRELARRFNHLYGKEPGFEELVKKALLKIGEKNAKLLQQFMNLYQEQGDKEALLKGQDLLKSETKLSIDDKEHLLGFLESTGRVILPEPHVLLTSVAKMPGLDGQKMSKSYNNTIGLTEEPKAVETKIRVMPTDPARVKRTDPGEPEKCPVWSLHKIFSNDETKSWVLKGCRSAGIGCIECKKSLSDAIIKEQAPIIERAKEYSQNKKLIVKIVQDGAHRARDIARKTLKDVREAMGISYK